MTARTLACAFRIGSRRTLAHPAAMLGVVAIFLALTLSYGRMLHALPDETLARIGYSREQLVWYLVLTETVIMGTGIQFREMQEDIQSGRIDIALLRPMPFWLLKIAEWTGQQCVSLCVLLPFSLATGLVMAGVPPLSGASAFFPPACLIALQTMLAINLMIGASSLWIGESRPVAWLYQKFNFLLGGLLWPLAFYPAWLRHVAAATPFPAIVAGIGGFGLGKTTGGAVSDFAVQLAWLALVLALTALTGEAVRRKIAR